MVDVLIGGILRGGIYVLIALGLSLVWGVMKIPNFAHGEFYLIGAYACYFGIQSFGLPPILALLFRISDRLGLRGSNRKSNLLPAEKTV